MINYYKNMYMINIKQNLVGELNNGYKTKSIQKDNKFKYIKIVKPHHFLLVTTKYIFKQI